MFAEGEFLAGPRPAVGVGELGVGVAEIVAKEVPVAHGFEELLGGVVVDGSWKCGEALVGGIEEDAEHPVVAVGDAIVVAVFPDVSAGRASDVGNAEEVDGHSVVLALGVVVATASAVVVDGVAATVGVNHSGGGPDPAVLADFGADIEVVEKDEPFGEGVEVGGHRPREEGLFGIAVAFFDVAEDVVVGAVFLDDVDDMGDAGVFESGKFGCVKPGSQAVVFDDLGGVAAEVFEFAEGEVGDGARNQVLDVGATGFSGIDGVGMLAGDAFCGSYEKRVILLDDSSGEPSGGDVALEVAGAEVDDGECIHVAEGDKEGLFVGGEFEPGGAGSGESTELVGAEGDCIDDFVGARVDDADGVAAGVGDEEFGLVGVEEHADGRGSDFDGAGF